VSFKDAGSMPEEWQSFSVEMIENNAANCPLSYGPQLTERIKDAVQNNTRLVLNTNNGGEIEISGKISRYSVTPIAIQQDDNASQNRLTIGVSFSININAPESDNMPLSVSRFADFESNVNLASVEAQLIEEINEQIAQDIINKLLSNW
jgi:outer membrane lipopolysaccharide assembly protein LptE/RlpB